MTFQPTHSITYELTQISPTHARDWLQTKRSEKRPNRQQVKERPDEVDGQHLTDHENPTLGNPQQRLKAERPQPQSDQAVQRELDARAGE